MEIKKTSFVYKLAFGCCEQKPEYMSLCKFFWRVALGLFTLPLLMIMVFLIVFCISVVTFFFGKRMRFGNNDNDFVEIEHWPTIRNYRILPWHIALAAVFVWAVKWLVIFGMGLVQFSASIQLGNVHMPTVYAGICFAVLALLLHQIGALWKSDAGKLFSAFIKAKKDRVCPTVVFR